MPRRDDHALGDALANLGGGDVGVDGLGSGEVACLTFSGGYAGGLAWLLDEREGACAI